MNQLMASFANHQFTDQTYKVMCELRDSAQTDGKSSRATYEQACSMLSGYVWSVADTVAQGFVHMQHPEQSFSTQDHLVKPWNKLQAARSHTCFLKDAPGETPIDLEEEISLKLTSFETVFNDRVLQPLANLFDMGDYTGAEGVRFDCSKPSPARCCLLGKRRHSNPYRLFLLLCWQDASAVSGFKWVTVFVMQLQNAHERQDVGAESRSLSKLARNALDEERERQRKFLAKPFILELPEGDDPAEEMGGVPPLSHEEREHRVDKYFEASFKRLHEMTQCSRSELAREYQAATGRVQVEVRHVITKVFGSLLDKDFLSLRRQHVHSIERLLSRMETSMYSVAIVQIGLNFSNARQAIEAWRQAQPDQIDPTSFKELTPEKQAEAIRHTDRHSPRYMALIRDFNSAHTFACETTRTLLNTNPADVPPNAITAAMGEVRARASHAHDLPGANVDLNTVAELEECARTKRNQLETSMLSPSGIFLGYPPVGDPARRKWDASLKSMIPTYTSLVKVAPFPSKVAPLSGARCQPSEEAKQVMAHLVGRLQETLDECLALPQSVEKVALKSEAFARLQMWEPSEALGTAATGPSELSMISFAAQLEEALLNEGSLNEKQSKIGPLAARAESHSSRAAKMRTMISDMVQTAGGQLGAAATFDPRKDTPLDPKPFEVLLSREMDSLVQLVAWELRTSIDSLKQTVSNKAQDNLKELREVLRDQKKNKFVNEVLERWKFLEPLSSLRVFDTLPGPHEIDAELKDRTEILATQAKTAVAVGAVQGGKQGPSTGPTPMGVAKSILRLAKLGSDVARASVFVSQSLNEVLSLAEGKFDVSGMQTLASDLRFLEPALANEIISTSDAFQTLVIQE